MRRGRAGRKIAMVRERGEGSMNRVECRKAMPFFVLKKYDEISTYLLAFINCFFSTSTSYLPIPISSFFFVVFVLLAWCGLVFIYICNVLRSRIPILPRISHLTIALSPVP